MLNMLELKALRLLTPPNLKVIKLNRLKLKLKMIQMIRKLILKIPIIKKEE